jgi:hypothetical protein
MPMTLRRILSGVLLLAYALYFVDMWTEVSFFNISSRIGWKIFVIASLFVGMLIFSSPDELREHIRSRRNDDDSK